MLPVLTSTSVLLSVLLAINFDAEKWFKLSMRPFLSVLEFRTQDETYELGLTRWADSFEDAEAQCDPTYNERIVGEIISETIIDSLPDYKPRGKK